MDGSLTSPPRTSDCRSEVRIAASIYLGLSIGLYGLGLICPF